MIKKILPRIILITWIIIWVVFLVRPYFKKDILGEYASLIKLSTEEKRAYVTGEELYAFIKFCKAAINQPSTYKVIGIKDYSIEHRRLTYYLYPNIENADPEYLLVYKTKDSSRSGYKDFSRLNAESYILRKEN